MTVISRMAWGKESSYSLLIKTVIKAHLAQYPLQIKKTPHKLDKENIYFSFCTKPTDYVMQLMDKIQAAQQQKYLSDPKKRKGGKKETGPWLRSDSSFCIKETQTHFESWRKKSVSQ